MRSMFGYLMLGLGLVSAGASAMEHHGTYALEMSDGRVYTVAFSTTFSVTPDHKITGEHSNVWLEDSTGNRIAMESRSEPHGLVITQFTGSKDSLEIRSDLGFTQERLAMPTIVTINGEKFRALLKPGADEAEFQKKIGPAAHKVAPGFFAALQALYTAGEGGYANLGGGWVSLVTVYDQSELSLGLQVVTAKQLSESDAANFASKFGK